MADLLEQVRRALIASKRSRHSISRETGIADSGLSRFASGERGLSVPLLERLANALGLEIVIRPTRRRKVGSSNSAGSRAGDSAGNNAGSKGR